MAAYFLRVLEGFKKEEVTIDHIVETTHCPASKVVLLSGYSPCYEQKLKKKVVYYRPSLLLALVGEPSLKLLLRIKQTYGPIQGILLISSNDDLESFLKDIIHQQSFFNRPVISKKTNSDS